MIIYEEYCRMSPRASTTITDKGPLKLSPINDYGDTKFVEQLLGDTPVLSESLRAYSISRYQADYGAQVHAYQTRLMQKTGLIRPPTEGIVDHTFFRRLYQNLLRDIHERHLVRPQKDEHDLSITLASLLGEDGLALCRLAIEEETHSLAYREAVFARATHGYTGEAWEQQPGIIIAGPSGSGKSHAAASIISDITGSQRISNEHTGPVHNFLVTVDGEYGRKTSHVFEDTMALAEAFGFKHGVSDLHDRTQAHTEGAKRILRQAAFLAAETGKAGLIMPETFTDYFISTNIRQAMKRFIQLCQNSRINAVFVDIEASQDAVRHDAEARAKIQSKAYNKWGFSLSEFCSTYVKNILRKKTGHHINFITYTNDRILVKPQNDTWVETQYGAKGAMPVSRRVHQAWLNIPAADRPNFKDYAQEQHTQALLRFEHVLRARQQLKRYVLLLRKQAKTTENLAKINYFNQVLFKTRNNPDENAAAIVDSLIESANQVKVRANAISPLTFFSQQERKLLVTLMQALISDPGESLNASYANLFNKHQGTPVSPNNKWVVSNQKRRLSENFIMVFNPDMPDRIVASAHPILSDEDDFDDDLHPFINSARDAIVAYHERGLQPGLRQRIENLLIDIDSLLEVISAYPKALPHEQMQERHDPEMQTSLRKQIHKHGKQAMKQANKLANKVDALTDKVIPKDPLIVIIGRQTWKHMLKPVGNYLTRQATPAINQLRQAVGMEPLQTATRESTLAASLNKVYPKFMENLYSLINFNLSVNELIRKNPDPKKLAPKNIDWLQSYWGLLQKLQTTLANNYGLREKINGKLEDRQALATFESITKKIFDYYYKPAHLTVEEKRKILSDKEEAMLADLAQTLHHIMKEPMREPATQVTHDYDANDTPVEPKSQLHH